MGHRKQIPPPSIGDECEAFLAGRSLQLHEEAGVAVPLWARLNRLARASYDDLVELAGTEVSRRRRAATVMTWDTALILLARQLLADSDPDQVRARQREVLQPLEPQSFANGPFDLFPDEFFDFIVQRMAESERDDQEHR
jgi:hypothetical protein